MSTNSTQLTGGEWINYTPGQAFTIGEGKSGYHYLFIKQVTDNVGNLSTGSSNVVEGTTYHGGMRLGFDNTPPTAGTMTMKLGNSEGTTYTNDTYTNQNVYIEQVQGADELSGHNKTTYSVRGAITLEDQTEATTLTETGVYTITVTTADYMGNTSTNTYTVKIDKILPTLTVNPTSGEYAKTREVTITVTDEGGSNLNNNNSYQYYLSSNNTTLSGGEWINYTNGRSIYNRTRKNRNILSIRKENNR